MHSSLRGLGISLVIGVLLVACRQGWGQTVTWTGAGDGGSWNQAANWSSNPNLPGPSNDVVIPAGAQGINMQFTNATIRSLNLSRFLLLNNGSISVTNGITLNNGTISGSGIGELSFVGGTQVLGGTGEIIGGIINARSGCQLTIGAGLLCRYQTGSGVGLAFNMTDASTISNQGVLRASGSPLGTGMYINSSGIGSTFVNFGTLEVINSGTLTVGTGSGTGSTFVNSGTLEVINSGTLTVGTGTLFTNNGTITINTGGTLTCNGITSPAQLGTINRVIGQSTLKVGGTFNVIHTYTLTNATGPIIFSCSWTDMRIRAVDGLTLQFDSGTTFTNVTLTAPSEFTGGTNVTGPLEAATPMVISNGGLSLGAGLTLTGGSTVLMTSGSLNFVNGTSQTLAGNAELVSGFNSTGYVAAAGCALTIGPGIVMRTDSGTTGTSQFNFSMGTYQGVGASIVSQGTIRSSGTAGRSVNIRTDPGMAGYTLTNSGTMEFLGGSSLNINAGITLANSGELTLGPGVLVQVLPGAAFTQTTAGRITHQINASGTALGTYGRMVVRGIANLTGAIRVQYVDGHNPQTCRMPVALISAEGLPTPIVAGTFSSTQMPPKGGMLHGAITYTSAGVNYLSTGIGDVAGLGGSPVPDGQFTADDIVVFLGAFFAGNLAIADVAMLGGAPGPDGQLTADDIILFLGSFFAGCP